MGNYRLLLPLLLLLFDAPLRGQTEEAARTFMLKTYPLRYLYGLNLEGTYIHSNFHQISLFYQNHQRDWISTRQPLDELGFSLIPKLLPSEGHCFYFSYQFPVDKKNIWVGPKIGAKSVFAIDSFSSHDGSKNEVWVDQDNRYLLCQLTLRNRLKGFIFEAYLHTGLVQISKSETFFRNGVERYTREATLYLPHILAGFSLGWGF